MDTTCCDSDFFFFFFLRRKLVDDQTHLHWFHLSGKLLKGPLLEYDQLKLKCYKLHESAPSMKLTFSWWGGLSTKKFQQNCINEESSPEPCTWVNTLGKIRKTFSSYSTPLGVMSFARFNWHSFAQLPAWRFLLWLSMKWRQRYLIQKYFLIIPSLTWTLALFLLFCSVRGYLYGESK